MPEPLLSVRRLTTMFETERGPIRAADDVSFDVPEGATVALVGESGCGKSVTALSILGLVVPPGRIAGGEILFRGENLVGLPDKKLRAIRGAQISMIFQEPMTSLNPVYTVGAQIAEVLRIHGRAGRRRAHQRAVELLGMVGIASPEVRAGAYPHQLSGGMRQRVMIAMALACEPKLLIADEPTTALDVTVQAQILDLLRKLKSEIGMGILFITHDLGIVAEFADHLVVMYAGRVVESGAVRPAFERPLHPYTRGLLASIPALGSSRQDRPRRLPSIEGIVPDIARLGPGCRFAERCSVREKEPAGYERCDEREPDLAAADDRFARCYYPGDSP